MKGGAFPIGIKVNVVVHAPAEVLVEGQGVVEHLAHVRDAVDRPTTDVLVEGRGAGDGASDGGDVGNDVGTIVGVFVGTEVGTFVGVTEGSGDGAEVGAAVGAQVLAPPGTTPHDVDAHGVPSNMLAWSTSSSTHQPRSWSKAEAE